MGYHHSVLVAVVVSTSVNYTGENMKLFLLPCLLVVCHQAALEALPMQDMGPILNDMVPDVPNGNEPIERGESAVVKKSLADCKQPFLGPPQSVIDARDMFCAKLKCTSEGQIGAGKWEKCEKLRVAAIGSEEDSYKMCPEWEACQVLKKKSSYERNKDGKLVVKSDFKKLVE